MSTPAWQFTARTPERRIGPPPATNDERRRMARRLEANPPKDRRYGGLLSLLMHKPMGFGATGVLGSRWRATFAQWREMCDASREGRRKTA